MLVSLNYRAVRAYKLYYTVEPKTMGNFFRKKSHKLDFDC